MLEKLGNRIAVAQFLSKKTFLQKNLYLQSEIKVQIEKALKSRSSIQGHRDKLDTQLVDNVSGAKPQFTKKMLGIGAILGFRLVAKWSFTNALTKFGKLNRDNCKDPAKELNQNPEELIKKAKSLYGTTERGDHCGRKFQNDLKRWWNGILYLWHRIVQQNSWPRTGWCVIYIC